MSEQQGAGSSITGNDRYNNLIAVCVALVSVFLAISNVKDGNIVQAMNKAKADAVSIWGEYQGKRGREFMLATKIDEVKMLGATSPINTTPEGQAVMKSWTDELQRLRDRMKEHIAEAQGHEKDYDTMGFVDDQFDVAETLMAMSLALFAIAALTRVHWMFGFALVVGGLGVFFSLAAFLGWSAVHPAWLGKLLGT